MNHEQHRRELIHILHMAYSGELAAAFAYAGHWRAVRDSAVKDSIKKIENDEWVHRRAVGRMLRDLGGAPQKWRELMMACIGSSAFSGCFVSGWFFPMYFAGRLENANTREYFVAASHARALGLDEMAKELMELSEVELSHEDFFRNIVQGHILLPLMIRFFTWGKAESIEERSQRVQALKLESETGSD